MDIVGKSCTLEMGCKQCKTYKPNDEGSDEETVGRATFVTIVGKDGVSTEPPKRKDSKRLSQKSSKKKTEVSCLCPDNSS